LNILACYPIIHLPECWQEPLVEPTAAQALPKKILSPSLQDREEIKVASSLDEIFRKFLSEMSNSDDENISRIRSLIERDRFGVEQLDTEIQDQLEHGNYGERGKKIWLSFREEHIQSTTGA
jgi:hypothetical protein